MKVLFDTNSLISLQEDIFKTGYDEIFVSSLSLVELENIKTSGTRDELIKYSVRALLHILQEKENQYTIIPYNTEWDQLLIDNHYLMNNDARIISTAAHLLNKEDFFVTDDLACKTLAKAVGLQTKFSKDFLKKEEYTGYKKRHVTSEEALADIYENVIPNNSNVFGLLTNQYLLIEDQDYNIIDAYCWTNNSYERIKYQKIDTNFFGKIGGKDYLQHCAIHSLRNNKFTILRGPAGSAKTLFALTSLFEKLERGQIDKIVVLANPIALKGSTKLGFYPGSRDEKLLGTTTGGILSTKLGSITYVEQMLDEGTLELIPFSDLRGINIEHAGVLISEAQNLDINLMKTAIQRVSDDCYLIAEGDTEAQLDSNVYEGKSNGMRRAIEVFKGDSAFGTITLKNIYRGHLTEIAEKM